MHPNALLALLAAAPLAAATCNWQSTGTLATKWRLSTYSSQDCLNIVQDVTKSGFGTWCINIPDSTRSFIFSVGSGYAVELGSCQIFFYTSETCGGDQVGRSDGEWKKATLTTNGGRMASAYVQCTRLLGKRAAEDGKGERKFVRADDGLWYEEVADGVVVRAEESAIQELEAGAEVA